MLSEGCPIPRVKATDGSCPERQRVRLTESTHRDPVGSGLVKSSDALQTDREIIEDERWLEADHSVNYRLSQVLNTLASSTREPALRDTSMSEHRRRWEHVAESARRHRLQAPAVAQHQTFQHRCGHRMSDVVGDQCADGDFKTIPCPW